MRINACALLVFMTYVVLTSSVFAQNSTQPPPNQQPILTADGKGVQIYTCQDVSGVLHWNFQAPEAKLFDTSGKEIGAHGAGPVWKLQDGSSVKGQLVEKGDAPEPGDIPWLLLKAAGHEGAGMLGKVEYIRRSETHGGIAPAAGCDAEHVGVVARIPYTAVYTFYAPHVE
jgi:Protein of unknown function (DUF3455)